MAKVALLVGVSEYQPGLQPLPSAAQDVVAMQRVLKHPEMGEFNEVKILTNPKTKELEIAIYDLFAERQKEDVVLFYFSGHGVKDEHRNLYLTTSETRTSSKGIVVTPTAVAASYLQTQMSRSLCQRQVLILDCCYSGAIAFGLTAKDESEIDIKAELGGKGRAILTSSTSVQSSFQQDQGLSIYTQYLVEGIETGAADKDGDGRISAYELHQYASGKVKEVSPAMTPQFYPAEEGFRIYLARAPQNDPKLEYRKAVEEIVSEDREDIDFLQGEIDYINRRTLNELQTSLGLSPQEAQAIETEVMEPYRLRFEKLKGYEKVFKQAWQQQNSISDKERRKLRRFQEALGLRDKDVSAIEESIAQPSKPEAEKHEEPVKIPITQKSITRKQLLKWIGLGGGGLVTAVVVGKVFNEPSPTPETTPSPTPETTPSPPPETTPSPTPPTTKNPETISVAEPKYIPSTEGGSKALGLPQWTVEFETVTVDARGEVVKRNSNQKAQFFKEDLGNDVILEMVSIAGGKFQRGTEAKEIERLVKKFKSDLFERERPQREVTVQPFFMGRYAITQKQWRAVESLPKVKTDLESDPSRFKGDDLPVEQVSWSHAEEFCQRLSEHTRREYRLPSEAEWEYACRAGTKTPFHYGETLTYKLANYNVSETYALEDKGDYKGKTMPVGNFPPNAFGLYDMHGNVWEWCADDWHDNYENTPTDGSAWIKGNHSYNDRVLRGGSWSRNPAFCRCASRDLLVGQNVISGRITSSGIVGFRVVCVGVKTT